MTTKDAKKKRITALTSMAGVSRRSYLKGIGAVGSAGFLAGCVSNIGGGQEDEYPSQDIEIVVHYGYGSGGYNEYPRLVGQFMNEILPDGVNTRVTNMEGSSGQIGTNYVWNAEPDGYTILMINMQAQVVNQIRYGDDFEPDLREFTWLPAVAIDIQNLSVAQWSDIESVQDYIDRMTSDDPPVHATTSLSGSQTMGPVMLGELSGQYEGRTVLDNTVVFTTSADSIVAAENQDIEVMFGSHSTNHPYLEEGLLRAVLNNTLDDEEESWEELPFTDGAETLSSSEAIDDNTAQAMTDLFNSRRPFCGPPGMAEDRADYLRDVMEQAITDPELHEAGEAINRPVTFDDAETVEQAVNTSIEVWGEYEDLLREVSEE